MMDTEFSLVKPIVFNLLDFECYTVVLIHQLTKERQAMAKRKPRIKKDERNVNVHNETSKNAVKDSIASLGAGRSILIDGQNTIIAGECTFEQATELGIPVRVVETDGSELIAVKRTDMKTDDVRRRALAIADNKTSMLSDFDYVAMSTEMKTLNVEFESVDDVELTVTGFAEFELKPLLDETFTYPPENEDNKPEKNKPAGSGQADNSSAGLQSDGKTIFFGQDQFEVVDRIIAYAHDQQGDEASDSECIVWALLKVLDGSSF
jgi:hypothetical protein